MLDAGASEHAVCGWARAVGRPGQACGTLELGELGGLDADMFTTVFVGNSTTRLVRGRMVTPRGYGGLR
jgi:precorrin-3B C17-methyltransferase